MENFAYVKGTEIRNLLFFGLLPNLNQVLSINHFGHLAMYVCALRLLHSGHSMEEDTSVIAGQLLDRFHQDHSLFYHRLQSFKLHLHSHFAATYRNYGSFANLGCFGQESLIGFVSENYHHVRYYGDAITHYFNVDFSLQNGKRQATTVDGPHDRCASSSDSLDVVTRYHHSICDCDKLESCCEIYRRYSIHRKMFHSLIYTRRIGSISYFVRYKSGNSVRPDQFGAIELFFTCRNDGYAVIKSHRVNGNFSDCFNESSYYQLLKQPIEKLYYLLERNYSRIDVVPVDLIVNHCILVEQDHHLLVTNILSYHEHD